MLRGNGQCLLQVASFQLPQCQPRRQRITVGRVARRIPTKGLGTGEKGEGGARVHIRPGSGKRFKVLQQRLAQGRIVRTRRQSRFPQIRRLLQQRQGPARR